MARNAYEVKMVDKTHKPERVYVTEYWANSEEEARRQAQSNRRYCEIISVRKKGF